MVRCYFLSAASLNGERKLYKAENVPRFRNEEITNATSSNRETILAIAQKLLVDGQ